MQDRTLPEELQLRGSLLFDKALLPKVQWELFLEDSPSSTELKALWDLISGNGALDVHVGSVGVSLVRSRKELRDLFNEYMGFPTMLGRFDSPYFAFFPYAEYWILGRRAPSSPALLGLCLEDAVRQASEFDHWGSRNIRAAARHYLS